MKHLENNFAEACFKNNSLKELIEAVKSGVDAQDCAEWGLTTEAAQKQVKIAIFAKIADNFELWCERFDAGMSEEDFDSMTIDEKIDMQLDAAAQ